MSFVIKEGKERKGLYSLVHFDANQALFEIRGKILSRDNILSALKVDNLLQISQDHFLDLTSHVSDYINHSCNPNCLLKIIGKTVFLVTTRAIIPEEELTFDYSTSSTDTRDEWNMLCTCGAWNCRKEISGFVSLESNLQLKYRELKMIPNYIKII